MLKIPSRFSEMGKTPIRGGYFFHTMYSRVWFMGRYKGIYYLAISMYERIGYCC